MQKNMLFYDLKHNGGHVEKVWIYQQPEEGGLLKISAGKPSEEGYVEVLLMSKNNPPLSFTY